MNSKINSVADSEVANTLLVEQEKVKFGRYKKAFTKANLRDSNLFSDFPVLPPWQRLRLKEFQVVQAGNSRFFMFFGIINFKHMGQLVVRIYDRLLNQHHIVERYILPWRLQNPSSLYDSTLEYRTKNHWLKFENDWDNKKIQIKMNVASGKNNPAISGEIEAVFNDSEDMVSSIPLSGSRPMYAHKCLGRISGHLHVGNEKIDFSVKDSFIFVDDHKAYYPFSMFWDWATAAANTKQGYIGFSLTHNQSRDCEQFNENGLWVDGKLHQLPAIQFLRNDESPALWVIKDRSGIVDLSFQELTQTTTYLNLGIFKANYLAPQGVFNGYIKQEDGKKILINNFYGIAEKFRMQA